LNAVTVRLAASVTAAAAALLLAACTSDTGTGPAAPGDGSAALLAAAARPVLAGTGTVRISVSDFNRTFSAMKKLRPVTKAGHGSIAAILPDTVSSTRYVEFDAPYLKKAFTTAGLRDSQFVIQNALGSDATQFADAQADITKGARVLILDPLDSGVGAKIESYARRHGVPVIDYDRLTLGGSRRYYVSFDDVAVGKAMGLGLVSCARAWDVKMPMVIVMKGNPADYEAVLFAQGYDQVMAPYFKSGKWVRVSQPPGTWDPPTALSEFRQQYAAHPDISAALSPNDENSTPIIAYLKTRGIKAKTFPITGQDATLSGLRNVLIGYQCGTAYKPIYLEAQGAVALALFLRARLKPPASLVNGHVKDAMTKVRVPSVLFKPVWVTTKNMKSTVIADNYVPVSQLCAGRYAKACKAAGIIK
jgi:D-xylose transport system substrate-binding protein